MSRISSRIKSGSLAHCTESVSHSVSDNVTYWAWNDCSLIKCLPMDIVAGMRVRNVIIYAWQKSVAFWSLFTAKLSISLYILLRTWSVISLSCISLSLYYIHSTKSSEMPFIYMHAPRYMPSPQEQSEEDWWRPRCQWTLKWNETWI